MPAARKKFARMYKRKLERELGIKGTNVGVYGSPKKFSQKQFNPFEVPWPFAPAQFLLSKYVARQGGTHNFEEYKGGLKHIVFINQKEAKEAVPHEMAHTLFVESQHRLHGLSVNEIIKRGAISEGFAISFGIDAADFWPNRSKPVTTKALLKETFRALRRDLRGWRFSPSEKKGIKLAILILQAAPYDPKKRSEIRAAIAKTKFKNFEECMNFVRNNYLKKKTAKE